MPRCADRVTSRGRSQRDGQFTDAYARDTLVDTMPRFRSQPVKIKRVEAGCLSCGRDAWRL